MNNKKVPRKVISIPVHFVSSQNKPNPNPFTSAIKIQKLFRGFLVRKFLKIILGVKSDVDKAEKTVLDRLDYIRNDPKERLKMNETLMGLLFKLDSVRGLDPGVRECRKRVIKKAIVLQEIIDGCDRDFVMGDMGNVKRVESGHEKDLDLDLDLEMRDVIELKGSDGFESLDVDLASRGEESEELNRGLENEVKGSDGFESFDIDLVSRGEESEELNRGLENEDGFSKAVLIEEKIDSCVDVNYSDKVIEYINQGLDEDMIENGENYVPQLTKDEKFVEPEMEEDDDYCLVKKVVVGEGDCETKPVLQHLGNDCVDGESGGSREKEMLERMIEENGKMMSMMKRLSEQNQAQTQMLSLLSQRVEHLEKAFVREISRKKTKDKKKRMANGVVDGLDCCSDQKKCGKKR